MNLTTYQQHALKVMSSGANVFISGTSGSEKALLLDQFMEEKKDKNIVRCASAAMCAVNDDSDTLLSLFSIPMGILKVGGYNSAPQKKLENADIIIIDDISSYRIDVFEYAIRTLQNITNKKKLTGDIEHCKKQIILIGDFHEHLPVLKRKDRTDFVRKWGLKRETDLFAFNSSLWDELHLESIILEDSVRYDLDEKNPKSLHSYEQDQEPSRIFKVVSTFYNNITHSKTSDSFHIMKVRAKDYFDWDFDEDAQLQDEWARGFGIDEISRTHGRTVGAIRVRLRQI